MINFEGIDIIDWADDSPPNLLSIGQMLSALESDFSEDGLCLPESYVGAEALMDSVMIGDIDYKNVVDLLRMYVSILKEMEGQIDPDALVEVYEALIDASGSDDKGNTDGEIPYRDGGLLLLELQSEEDRDSLCTFCIESIENIEELDNKLPLLAKSVGDSTLLNDLFRGYHTIKGAAGFFGLNPITSVTHELENVLDKARHGKVSVDDEVILLMNRANLWIKNHFNRLEGLLKVEEGAFECVLPIDAFSTIYYSGKAILSRPEESIEMVEGMGDGKDKDNSIRISQEYLDLFLDEVGGMINLAHIFNHSVAILEKSRMERSEIQSFKDNFSILEDRTRNLQKNLMKLRSVKLDAIFKKIPKIIYKLSQVLGKQVEVICEGGELEIDRGLLDNLEEPLVHILRNSMDHGFEDNEERVGLGKPYVGNLRISGVEKGNFIHLEIIDDGRGINGEKVANSALSKGLISKEKLSKMSFKQKQDLIFLAGLSTQDKASEISGRGVGMDVVKSKILETGGHFELVSEYGVGTTIMIDLPKSATLSTRSILKVRVNDLFFGFPMDKIEYLSNISNDDRLPTIEGSVEVFPYRNQLLPIVHLSRIFGIEVKSRKTERNFLIIKNDGHDVVFEVDGMDEFEIQVIQDLLKGHFDDSAFDGASVLGDGSICLMLSINKMLKLVKLSVRQVDNDSEIIENTSSSFSVTNTLVFKPSFSDLLLSVDMSSVSRIDNFDESCLLEINEKKVYKSKQGLLPYYEFSDVGIGGALKSELSATTIIIININSRPLAFGISEIVDMYSDVVHYFGKLSIPGVIESWSYNGKLVGVIDLGFINKRLGNRSSYNSSRAKELVC